MPERRDSTADQEAQRSIQTLWIGPVHTSSRARVISMTVSVTRTGSPSPPSDLSSLQRCMSLGVGLPKQPTILTRQAGATSKPSWKELRLLRLCRTPEGLRGLGSPGQTPDDAHVRVLRYFDRTSASTSIEPHCEDLDGAALLLRGSRRAGLFVTKMMMHTLAIALDAKHMACSRRRLATCGRLRSGCCTKASRRETDKYCGLMSEGWNLLHS
jgi:hypothetical protein